jgi:acyl-CoA thioesterase I
MRRSDNKSRLGRIWIGLFLSAAGPSIVATDANPDSRIVVALGASQTAGKGLSHDQAFPAQLEGMLHAKGYDVRVLNEGTSGDTTSGMLNRLDQAIPSGRKVEVLQPRGNDWRTVGAAIAPPTSPKSNDGSGFAELECLKTAFSAGYPSGPTGSI